jgi:hypothetical protein
MRTTFKAPPGGRSATRKTNRLPDGTGGTIAGGPMRPIDLMDFLRLGSHGVSMGGVSMGGAVSGAAANIQSASPRNDRGIALSDGSRIVFASVADDRVFADA